MAVSKRAGRVLRPAATETESLARLAAASAVLWSVVASTLFIAEAAGTFSRTYGKLVGLALCFRAGIYNVCPGAVTVIGTPAGLGKPASRATVLVKPGFVTVVQLVPSP